MKKCFGIVLSIIIVIGLLSACESSDIEDQVINVMQSEDTHVLSVKGGTPSAYSEMTYGEAFESFFGSPTWKYFVGTKEGADEDGDGRPDYTEENVEIVEFTGYCTYQDIEVKALIQFTLSKEDDTFEATYLSFNDVPQNMFTLAALLEAVFTNEDIDIAVGNNSNESVQENDDVMLEEFISLICSYSDPPDLEGAELTEYFKGEFDIWLSGEGYKNITIDSDGHLVIPDHSAEYVGTWWDTYSQRCNMEISSYDGIYYNIDINWGSSAWDNTHWSFNGTYDEIAGGIHYYGSRIEEYYLDNGEMQETYIYSDGEGLIWIGDEGMLYWDDYIEQQGVECSFEKSEYEEYSDKGNYNGEEVITGYLIPDSDRRYLEESDLYGFSNKELRLARNEIFARYGRKFNDKELQSYFDSCIWYEGLIEPEEFDDNILNEFEKANMKLIKELEGN